MVFPEESKRKKPFIKPNNTKKTFPPVKKATKRTHKISANTGLNMGKSNSYIGS